MSALTDVAYEDDAQVIDVLVTKRYGQETKTVICVSEAAS